MKAIVLAAVLAAVPALAVGEPAKSKPDAKTLPASAAKAKPCAEYGAGFVRVEATGACVKIGGYVRFESSRSR